MSIKFNIDNYIEYQKEFGILSEKELYIERRTYDILGELVPYDGVEYLDEIEDWKAYVDSKIKEYDESKGKFINFSQKPIERRFETVIDTTGSMIKISNYN